MLSEIIECNWSSLIGALEIIALFIRCGVEVNSRSVQIVSAWFFSHTTGLAFRTVLEIISCFLLCLDILLEDEDRSLYHRSTFRLYYLPLDQQTYLYL